MGQKKQLCLSVPDFLYRILYIKAKNSAETITLCKEDDGSFSAEGISYDDGLQKIMVFPEQANIPEKWRKL